MRKVILLSISVILLSRTTHAYTITLKSGDVIQCQVIEKDQRKVTPQYDSESIEQEYLRNLREIEGDPSVYLQEAGTSEVKPESDITRALKFIESDNLDEAERLLKKAVREIPQDWKAQTNKRGIYSIAYWDEKEYAETASCQQRVLGTLNKIEMAEPSYSSAYFWLSNIEIARNNPGKALQYLEKAEELEPDHPTIFYQRGYIYNRTGRYGSAHEEFKRSLNARECLSPKQKAEAYRGIGVALIGLERFTQAQEAFNKSLEYDPANRMVFNEVEYIKHLLNMYVIDR